MSERPVSETGNLIRSGFINIEKSYELLKSIDLPISQDELLQDLSEVANPDSALFLLVQILEKNDLDFKKVITDKLARQRLLKVIGASNGLGEFLVANPKEASCLLDEKAINLSFSKSELIERFSSKIKDGRLELVKEYRKFLLSLAARDLNANWPLREIALELSDAADAILQTALNHILKENNELSSKFDLAIIAMGKAGGQELNYVSDVDVIFVNGTISLINSTLPIAVTSNFALYTANFIS